MAIRNNATENLLFLLHWKVTSLLFFLCSIVVTFNYFYGSKMVCITGGDIDETLLTSYCSAHSTFSLYVKGKKVGIDIPYPGVDTHNPNFEDEQIYHYYYKWFYIILFIQGLLFYAPGALWSHLESGQFATLRNNLEKSAPTSSEQTISKTKSIKYHSKFFRQRIGSYNMYTLSYWFCENFSLLNAILQKCFISYVFAHFGLKNDGKPFEQKGEYLFFAFPRVAKCTFNRYGRSGDVQRHNAMCTLPVYVLMEQFYNFFSYWILILLILSVINTVISLLVIAFPILRAFLLYVAVSSPKRNFSDMRRLAKHLNFGDWFILDTLAKKTDKADLYATLTCLLQELEGNKNKLNDDDNGIEMD